MRSCTACGWRYPEQSTAHHCTDGKLGHALGNVNERIVEFRSILRSVVSVMESIERREKRMFEYCRAVVADPLVREWDEALAAARKAMEKI